jgi:hypothetical protein
MRSWNLVSLACLGALAACASTENGQTGSVGYACENDACAREAQDFLHWVGTRNAPTYVASHCREPNLGPADSESLSVQSCQCVEADGRVMAIQATGAGSGGAAATGDSVVSTEPCLAWGRGHLACVFPASEGHSCTTSEPDSCDAICTRLQEGYEEDAARSYDVELRSSGCRSRHPGDDPAGGFCANVARINDSCYVTTNAGFFGPEKYDCSLTDEQILDQRDGVISGQASAAGGGR